MLMSSLVTSSRDGLSQGFLLIVFSMSFLSGLSSLLVAFSMMSLLSSSFSPSMFSPVREYSIGFPAGTRLPCAGSLA